jgi:hypothetical protein
MRQIAQNYKSGELVVLDVPAPACRPGGVLVRSLYSLISTGTEMMKVSEAAVRAGVEMARTLWARVTGFFDASSQLSAVGIQCALCHSTVDNALASGIGHRLDGWANRDLNVGAIIGLSKLYRELILPHFTQPDANAACLRALRMNAIRSRRSAIASAV